MGQQPSHPFAIQWHPFQFNPDLPTEGVDRRSYMETKCCGRLNVVKVYARMLEGAQASEKRCKLNREIPYWLPLPRFSERSL